MKALVLRAEYSPRPGDAAQRIGTSFRRPVCQLETRQLGKLSQGQLRIEIERVGVCGSDLGVMSHDPDSGYIKSTVPLDVPDQGLILGHEGIGVVREVGTGVYGFRPGDWVVLESLIACQHCDPCRRGRFNQCINARLVGFQSDGLFSKVADLPAQLAHPLGRLALAEEGRRAAACIEPAACALVALEQARLTVGEKVLVFGAGPIGLFTAMLCRATLGAADIQVVEPSAERRRLAQRWADQVWEPRQFEATAIKPEFDLLVECSGALNQAAQTVRRLRPNARMLLLSRGHSRQMTLDAVDHLVTNAVSIIGSRGHLGGSVGSILRLLDSGRLPLHEAVTGVEHGLESVLQAMQGAAGLVEQHCKLQVRL